MSIESILLFIVATCEFIQYIPQIVKILMTKKADDLQTLSWVTWVVSAYCYFIYLVLQSQDTLLILVQLFEAICCTIILLLTKVYSRK